MLGNLSVNRPPPSLSGSCRATETTPVDRLACVSCNFAPGESPDSRKGCERSTGLLFCVLSAYDSGLSFFARHASSSTSLSTLPGVTLTCVLLAAESTTNTDADIFTRSVVLFLLLRLPSQDSLDNLLALAELFPSVRVRVEVVLQQRLGVVLPVRCRVGRRVFSCHGRR